MTHKLGAPEVVVTGLGWLGGNVRAVEVVLRELIAGARHNLDITAYSATSGGDEVWTLVGERVADGVMARIVVDDLDNQPVALRSQLRHLRDQHGGGIQIWNFPHESTRDGLHAKVFVADRTTAIVGSANLSFRGLTTAHELGLLVHGPAARKTAECIDRLILSTKTVRWP